MDFRVCLVVLVCCSPWATLRAAPFLENCRFLDLTHDFSSNTTLYWNARDGFNLDVVYKGSVSPGNYHYEAHKFSGAEHGGTHLDAPSHFSANGLPIDQLSLSNLVGPACVVDVSEKTGPIDYQITVSDLEENEKLYGKFSEKCVVLLNTNWSGKYHNRSQYFGTSTPFDQKSYHFPGLAPGAAQWLIDGRKLKMLGIDTPSLDHGQSIDFKVHQILASNDVIGLENLANLNDLPARGATIVALPMKIQGGSGGPVRVVAFGWNGIRDPCRRNSASTNVFIPLTIFMLILARSLVIRYPF